MAYIVIFGGFFLYFLPTLIAFYRKHHNKVAIGVGNLLLGWTVIGWLGFFIYSFTNKK